MRQAEAEQRAYEAEVRRLKAVEEEEREYQRKIKEAAIRAQVCECRFNFLARWCKLFPQHSRMCRCLDPCYVDVLSTQGRKKLMKQFNARYENKQEQARLREEKFKHEWDFLMQQVRLGMAGFACRLHELMLIGESSFQKDLISFVLLVVNVMVSDYGAEP